MKSLDEESLLSSEESCDQIDEYDCRMTKSKNKKSSNDVGTRNSSDKEESDSDEQVNKDVPELNDGMVVHYLSDEE